jgi:4'-phosphopantetheinyl transferase
MTMSPTHIAVWLLRLEPDQMHRASALLRFPELLTRDEEHRALRLADDAAGAAFVYGRALLQLMLRHYLPPLPAFAGPRCALRIEHGGKPVLAGPFADSGLEFNLAHEGNQLACAVAWRRQVGIDLVAADCPCDVDAIAEASYAPAERADLARLSGEARKQRFLHYWTLKEAYLKARGGNIAGQLEAISFVPREDGELQVHDALDKDADDNWGFHVLDVVPGRRVALCWERQSSCFAPPLELKVIDGAELVALAQARRPADALCI